MEPPTSVSTRPRISSAALLVKVTARISSCCAYPSDSRYAIRCAMTRVLPDPAPARMSSGPSIWRTASRCSGLRPVSGSMMGNLRKAKGEGVRDKSHAASDFGSRVHLSLTPCPLTLSEFLTLPSRSWRDCVADQRRSLAGQRRDRRVTAMAVPSRWATAFPEPAATQ